MPSHPQSVLPIVWGLSAEPLAPAVSQCPVTWPVPQVPVPFALSVAPTQAQPAALTAAAQPVPALSVSLSTCHRQFQGCAKDKKRRALKANSLCNNGGESKPR